MTVMRLYTRDDVLAVASMCQVGINPEDALTEAEESGLLSAHSPVLCAALSHPLRGRILAHMHSDGVETSPIRLAEALEEDLGVVSYHVRKLQAHGLIRLSKTAPRRGAVEHFYRLAP